MLILPDDEISIFYEYHLCTRMGNFTDYSKANFLDSCEKRFEIAYGENQSSLPILVLGKQVWYFPDSHNMNGGSIKFRYPPERIFFFSCGKSQAISNVGPELTSYGTIPPSIPTMLYTSRWGWIYQPLFEGP